MRIASTKSLLLFFILFLPGMLLGLSWTSPKGDLKISLEPDELYIGEKSVLRVETPGALVDEKKMVEKLLRPLNDFSEKIKIESMKQEDGIVTLVLIPLVEGTLSLHLESIPLSSGKLIAGEEMHMKVAMPTATLHRLLTAAAKPFPLDHQPIVDLSGDNRYNYVDGEKALEEERVKALDLFTAKRFPIAKLVLMLLVLCGAAVAYHHRNKIFIWLKTNLIPAYNPQKHAQKAIGKASRLYGKDARFFVSLTDTLRQYYGEIFNVDVQDLTTPELLGAFEAKTEMPKESLQDLHDILVQADRIKFAREIPTKDVVESVATKAMRLIDRKVEPEPQ